MVTEWQKKQWNKDTERGPRNKELLSFIGAVFLMGIRERSKPSKNDLSDYILYSPKEDM